MLLGIYKQFATPVHTLFSIFSKIKQLTHCDLMMPYGDKDTDQQWQQAITSTNVDLSSNIFFCIHKGNFTRSAHELNP